MRSRDLLVIVPIGGLVGIFIGFSMGLHPICGVAMFVFIVALFVMAWDRISSRPGTGAGPGLSSLFSRGGGPAMSDAESEVVEAEVVEVPGSEPDVSGAVPAEEHMVDIYRTVLGLDTDRARALYQAGYRRLEDLEGVGVQDLIKVEGINPTIARRITAAVARIFRD